MNYLLKILKIVGIAWILLGAIGVYLIANDILVDNPAYQAKVGMLRKDTLILAQVLIYFIPGTSLLLLDCYFESRKREKNQKS